MAKKEEPKQIDPASVEQVEEEDDFDEFEEEDWEQTAMEEDKLWKDDWEDTAWDEEDQNDGFLDELRAHVQQAQLKMK